MNCCLLAPFYLLADGSLDSDSSLVEFWLLHWTARLLPAGLPLEWGRSGYQHWKKPSTRMLWDLGAGQPELPHATKLKVSPIALRFGTWSTKQIVSYQIACHQSLKMMHTDRRTDCPHAPPPKVHIQSLWLSNLDTTIVKSCCSVWSYISSKFSTHLILTLPYIKSSVGIICLTESRGSLNT